MKIFMKDIDPPPYNSIETNNFVLNEKQNNEIIKVNKKTLNDISKECNNNLFINFDYEIMTLLKNVILDKKIRLLLGFYVVSSIEKQYKIEKFNDIINMPFEGEIKKIINNGYYPGHVVIILTKNDGIKFDLEKRYEQIIKKTDCQISMNAMLRYNNIKNKYNIPEKINDCKIARLSYDVLIKNSSELIQLYDEICKTIIDNCFITTMNETFIKCAFEGNKSYIYKSKDAEFIFEYIKYHNIFDDIDIKLEVGQIIFSW